MDLMSALSLGELALSFSRVPLFPVFDLSYFIVSIIYLKYEPGAVELSRRHPVASWLCAMLHCFGSYILADLLLGEPIIDYFSNSSSILLASGVCPTKASLYGAILFTLQQTRWLPVSKASLIFVFTMFMVSCKVFLTATHSHSSPFDILEGYICPVLFGATWGGDHHHDNHGAPHGMGLGTQHSGLPAKAKEELGEGSRKKKTKKAD
ncbi:trimeric intracellular cation channel type A isoform 2 [Mus musculus]|uniref:trimeric intracellular cation channel type A isoform 2 n=1 Tax=Mus musculus TaxID=10090 RepID=UPI00001F64EC|nr:trimeric intracellular cation channel type A isoform 2 [Mus musculus]|eukprot:XP_006509834.1 PREDICTED: trimeric intracellular cation channel type A isoform X1 [Mus musculus]